MEDFMEQETLLSKIDGQGLILESSGLPLTRRNCLFTDHQILL